MNTFVSWRRVSTAKQGMSGLGLDAQLDIIKHFVEQERGELIADFCEVYTGTELSGCIKLQEAITFAKKEKATLVIAKKDRGEASGGTNELWGKNTGADRTQVLIKAREARAASMREKAINNQSNIDFWHFAQDWQEAHGELGKGTDWGAFSKRLNERGKKTPTGLCFTPNRASSMYNKIKKIYYEL